MMKIADIRGNRHVVPLFVCAILLLSALLPFTSVTAVPEASTPNRAEVTLTEQDDRRQVTLTEDQVLVVRLEGNPSTGYLWDVAGIDKTLLREVGTIEFESDSALLGAPGKMVRRFEVVRPGHTSLALVYRRPWEKGEPAQTFSVQVQGVGPFTHVNSPSIPAAAPVAEPVASPTAADASSAQALPSSFDWCAQGGCTSVKDQGNCGSCWAFATVGPLESLIKLKDGVEKDLSEQYLLSCNMEGWSCGGGSWAHAYHLETHRLDEPDAGAVYEASFPYAAQDIACNPPHAHHEKIASWAYVGSGIGIPPVADIKQAIYDHGPVSVTMCAWNAFSYYSGGIFQTDETFACGGGVNHGVVLVGWDDTQGGGVWILRNSWGPGWGEGGYMRIKWGTSKVGYGASYVVYSGGSTAPRTPGPLQATPASQTQVNLAWIDTSTNEDGFQIERSLSGWGNWTPIATVGADVTVYANSGLTLGMTYYYRVRAYNTFGNSDYSNVAWATTFSEPMEAVYLPLIVDGGTASEK